VHKFSAGPNSSPVGGLFQNNAELFLERRTPASLLRFGLLIEPRISVWERLVGSLDYFRVRFMDWRCGVLREIDFLL